MKPARDVFEQPMIMEEEVDAVSGAGVSWAAVIAGAVASTAFALALITLGAGLGLGSISPWSQNNMSGATFGWLAGAWFVAVQLFASGVGGYLAGRLRNRWPGTHPHEVYFRDTAHGLMVWAVAAILTYLLLIAAASRVLETAAGLGAAAAPQVATATSDASLDYYVDRLLRSDASPPRPDATAQRDDLRRILARDLSGVGQVGGDDDAYLAQAVAARTGLAPADAQKRVADVLSLAKGAANQSMESAKAAADALRKTGVDIALWGFIALLFGAFSASYMATVGAHARDEFSGAP